MEVGAPSGFVKGEPPWLNAPPGFPALYWTLVTRVLPGSVDTLLLRATLADGVSATQAWQDWLRAVGDPVRAIGTDTRHIKVLVPLLAYNLDRHRIPTGAAFRTYARAAHLTETLRMSNFLRHAAIVADLFAAAAIPHVVLKGAALAENVYVDPAFRHAHDFDVLVPESRIDEAATLLQTRGFAPTMTLRGGYHHLPPLANDAGFTVELHRRLRNQHPRFDTDGLLARSRVASIGRRPSRMPSLPDALLHVCLHAVACESHNLRWVADAWIISERLSPEEWQTTVRLAKEVGLTLPVALTLGYLTAAIGEVVPPSALAAIVAEAASADRIERDAVAFGTRFSMPNDLRSILSMSAGWRERIGQLRWRLAPPLRHIQWMYGLASRWSAPFYYPFRVVTLARRLTTGAERRPHPRVLHEGTAGRRVP